MALTPGTKLGPYEILGSLGAGGMGEVYRARDPRLKRDVAIKVLPPELNTHPSRTKRFQIEAQSISALNHPHIVVVYDVGSENGIQYIVSELVEGESLRRVIGGSAVPARRLLELSVQIADGLAAAHQAGVIHRDLKPENIMVTSDGRAKILDFGLAKLADTVMDSNAETTDTLTRTGQVFGTAPYMSPEQAGGRELDFRTDQFSFGIILYEMMSGRRPFDRPTPGQTLNAIIEEDPPPFSSPVPAPPLPLRWIMERCLHKEPAQRYDSTRDLFKELRSIRDHASQAISSQPAVAVTRPRPRALRWVPFLLLPLFLAAGVFFGRSTAKSTPPRLHQLTFRRGTIHAARMAPDQQTVYYTATWEGGTTGLFSTRLDSPESSPVPMPGVENFWGMMGDMSISSTGKLAIRIGNVLSEASLAGGAPKQILDNVGFADWSPDGKDLVVEHEVNDRVQLEYPIGKVLYSILGQNIMYPRFSPKGNLIAFIEAVGGGPSQTFSVCVIDLEGHKRVLSSGWPDAYGLAWRPDGKEIWFTARKAGVLAIQAVDLSGHERFVFASPDVLMIQDILKDGSVLVINGNWPETTICQPPGETTERNVSWFDYSTAKGLTADGKTLLFDEGGAVFGSVFLRKSDGSTPAVRLGDGYAMSISPDGKWVIAQSYNKPGKLALIPTGPGETRTLDDGGIECEDANWFSDNRRILITGRAKGEQDHLFVQDILKGTPQPLTPEGIDNGVVTADGTEVATSTEKGEVVLYPVGGGPTRKLPFSLAPHESLMRWGVDNKTFYVFFRNHWASGSQKDISVSIFRYDLSTGKKELWKQLALADPTGVIRIDITVLSPEVNAYCYSYMRDTGNVFLVQGLK